MTMLYLLKKCSNVWPNSRWRWILQKKENLRWVSNKFQSRKTKSIVLSESRLSRQSAHATKVRSNYSLATKVSKLCLTNQRIKRAHLILSWWRQRSYVIDRRTILAASKTKLRSLATSDLNLFSRWSNRFRSTFLVSARAERVSHQKKQSSSMMTQKH